MRTTALAAGPGWVPGKEFLRKQVLVTVARGETKVAILEADGSCGEHYDYLMPPGTKFVVTDIDGTMTFSDDELFKQIDDGSYVPIQNQSADALMNAWTKKGYQVVYLTARPHLFRAETRRWLADPKVERVDPVCEEDNALMAPLWPDREAYGTLLLSSRRWGLSARLRAGVADLKRAGKAKAKTLLRSRRRRVKAPVKGAKSGSPQR